MTPKTPNIFNTVVPGNMDLEEWKAGGYSKFIHGDGSCKAEVLDAINIFKSY